MVRPQRRQIAEARLEHASDRPQRNGDVEPPTDLEPEATVIQANGPCAEGPIVADEPEHCAEAAQREYPRDKRIPHRDREVDGDRLDDDHGDDRGRNRARARRTIGEL